MGNCKITPEGFPRAETIPAKSLSFREIREISGPRNENFLNYIYFYLFYLFF